MNIPINAFKNNGLISMDDLLPRSLPANNYGELSSSSWSLWGGVIILLFLGIFKRGEDPGILCLTNCWRAKKVKIEIPISIPKQQNWNTIPYGYRVYVSQTIQYRGLMRLFYLSLPSPMISTISFLVIFAFIGGTFKGEIAIFSGIKAKVYPSFLLIKTFPVFSAYSRTIASFCWASEYV